MEAEMLVAPGRVARSEGEWLELEPGVELRAGAHTAEARAILTPAAVQLIAQLHRSLDLTRRQLLAARRAAQAVYDAGERPGYLSRNSEAVKGTWRVAPIPAELRRRRVEITGPIGSGKMVVQMLSRNEAGDRADTAMLDFEDSMKPLWSNVVAGVHHLIGAVDGTLTVESGGKTYRLDPADMAVPMVRVRGLHLDEVNLRIDGHPVSGGLLELALCLFHTGRKLVEAGRTPIYYIPKVEHHLEARWWNELFRAAQQGVGLPVGSLRATFLIETLPAAFQMEEILYEVREHAAGLNVGRWDKIFSDIKVLMRHPDRVLADRASIGMNRPWMQAYAKRLIHICHSRGAYAMGGMAAFTPGKSPELRAEQIARVSADKQLEADLGHDGCWVSHPYFIGAALGAFKTDAQLDRVNPADRYPDLLPQRTGPRTLVGLRTNLRVGIAYLNGWNAGLGCVAWDNLMEDLATLEISRAQTWQWLHHEVSLDDGRIVTRPLVKQLFAEELARIEDEVRAALTGSALEIALAGFARAAADAEALFTAAEFQPFLTCESEPVS